MLDLPNMAMSPGMALRGEELFLGGVATTNTATYGVTFTEYVWAPPKGATWAMIFAWNPGGGGGGGMTGAAGTARGGGGGGGAGSLWKGLLWLPAFADGPFFLILRPGHGGAGGAAAAAGFNGATTAIYIGDNQNGLILASHTSSANGGGAGTASAGGAGGVAPSLANQQLNHTFFGMIQPGSSSGWLTGNAGGAGGAQTGAAGTSITFPGAAATTTTSPFSGGAGGGGTPTGNTNFAGGNQNALGRIHPNLLGGAAGSNDGSGGMWLPRPLFGGRGGCGGGSNGNGVGGNGGHGAPGCGGGGGGGGTTGGRGGNGGPGGVLIMYG